MGKKKKAEETEPEAKSRKPRLMFAATQFPPLRETAERMSDGASGDLACPDYYPRPPLA